MTTGHASGVGGRKPGRIPAGLAVGSAIVLGVLGGGAGVYSAAIGPNLEPKRFGVVEEGKVYRSGEFRTAALAQLHEERGIRTIIDFGAHEPGSPEELREERAAVALGITRYVLRLEGDGTGNVNNYVRALEIMADPQRQPVLVHCAAGTQRTGCAIALYRRMSQGMSFEDGLREAARFDHDPEDNPHVSALLREHGEVIIKAAREGGNVAGFEPIAVPKPQ